MPQSHTLRNMSGTDTPDQCVFERLLQCPVDLVTDILDRGVAAYDQSLTEIGLFTLSVEVLDKEKDKSFNWIESSILPFGVYPDKSQFFPDPIHHLLDAKVEFTAHHSSIGFAG